MRLEYIYFDFTNGGANPDGYRGYKKCGFNFGTHYYYTMTEPTEGEPWYKLTREERPEGERIEPGFWGDERVYNFTALVGDNGVGKTTLIHEIIRCLVGEATDNLKGIHYMLLVRETKGDGPPALVLRHTLKEGLHVSILKEDFVPERKRLYRLTEAGADARRKSPLNDTKFIYLSNVLSMDDKQLYSYVIGECPSKNTMYTSPLYDCSLSTDMALALETSGCKEMYAAKAFDVYFNFRSYQEARYLFDRNQRKLLVHLEDTIQFPVPAPRVLKLAINSAMKAFEDLIPRDSRYGEYHKEQYLDYRSAYYNFLDRCQEAEEGSEAKEALENVPELSGARAFAAELSLNAIAYFCRQIKETEGRPLLDYTALPNDDAYTQFWEHQNYIVLLDSLCHKGSKGVYTLCKNYINLLWNALPIIHEFFQSYTITPNIELQNNISCRIPLGTEIDKRLEEFMIRFINQTRALSDGAYFVIYNWGLSSGESNLLHLFTKLRYLLVGTNFDEDDPTGPISEATVQDTPLAQRKEALRNGGDGGKGSHGNPCDSVILFLDEPDLTMHPDWQRQFVAILTAYLPKLFKEKYDGEDGGCKDIQVILGTHSPIMLGDFPGASVIYLKKKDGEVIVDDRSKLQPFGQNLYTILKEGFYLEKGTIGALAQSKINGIINDTKEIHSQLKKAKKREEKQKDGTASGEALPKHTYWKNSPSASKWIRILQEHKSKTVSLLPSGILRSKLTEEIDYCIECLDAYTKPPKPPKKNERMQELRTEINRRNAELLGLQEELKRLKGGSL